ncbi:hypothetical protein B1991_17880 [Rhodanobacter lindaniclasticus]|uniref:Uncharacterized protein n=1 Tax=Rhodanobacter lindaniclasticus TaxID=75310 RepID=A0A4S3K8Q9_9GAMM|nr:hypothetical protein B1991_17880 [Rhodanobacter lindaniclasticus]
MTQRFLHRSGRQSISLQNAVRLTSRDPGRIKGGVFVRTLQDWEQGRREPGGAAKALLKVAAAAPKTVRKKKRVKLTFPRRTALPTANLYQPPGLAARLTGWPSIAAPADRAGSMRRAERCMTTIGFRFPARTATGWMGRSTTVRRRIFPSVVC